MCGEESAALDLAPSEVPRPALAPPAAAGGRHRQAGREAGDLAGPHPCALADALVGFTVWFSHGKLLTSLVVVLN